MVFYTLRRKEGSLELFLKFFFFLTGETFQRMGIKSIVMGEGQGEERPRQARMVGPGLPPVLGRQVAPTYTDPTLGSPGFKCCAQDT